MSVPLCRTYTLTIALQSKPSNPAPAPECPVKYKNKDQYNVYSQKIDLTNQMPAVANNSPAPGQAIPLETNRVKSNIPKAGNI